MCKLAKFYEGGIAWESLKAMPIDEMQGVIREANDINKAQEAAMKEASKRGK